jgi:predicted hydrocarbon binding protein
MNEKSYSGYYYPNKMGRIILRALEEIIGREGMDATLQRADLSGYIQHYPENNLEKKFRFEDVSHIQVELEHQYGNRSGRGLALRSGRASFRYGLREFGPLMGCTDLAFRLLPVHAKLKAGVSLFAQMFNLYSDQLVRVEEESDRFLWHIDLCPVCWGRHADTPICHLAVGVLQESMYWVSGGKYFDIEETHCIAKGDPACTIVIHKVPME